MLNAQLVAPRVLIFSSLVAAGCLDGAATLVREGNAAAHAGRLTEARGAFAKEVTARPGDVGARVLFAHVLTALHETQAARAEYTSALERDPRCAEARLGLSRLALAETAPEAALELLAPLPVRDEARLLKARALLARGRPGDGALVREALGTSQSPEAAYLRGSALLVERHFAEAQATFEAVESASAPLARYGLARVAAAQGRAADVLVHLRAARIALGPQWEPLAVAADPAFDFVHDTPEFQPLLSK